ncbi:MAG TPA: hypothetical protein VGN82_14045 [Bosea sp. (in: a-proteobacteria)]|uniref:hypothetical protein n=1 Tax=Bosea sp. (in: a-proteobacteria) TaxID=1871050 RepID=UPI002E123993|nr:hypothetical protein [Bosea sp. (in: a-proteobacteria)]
MRFVLVLLCCWLWAPALAQAPATAALVQTSIAPSEGIVIGQPVLLHVKVLFPGEMPHPPMVKVAAPPGAQLMRFEQQAVTTRETVDGQDYVGQIFEFVVFPRRGGDVALPAADVTLLDRAGNPIGTAAGQALNFAVTIPAGIDPSGPVLAAPHVQASESWSPDPSSAFKAGDAITRTIRRKATDVPALGMAEFRFAAPAGVRVYADPPVVDDRVERGSVEGVRTDKVTYVFERPGTYALPPLSQPWWDTDDRRARSETLDGITVTVMAAAAPTPQGWRGMLLAWRRAIAAGLIGLALLPIILWAGPRLTANWQHRRERHLKSEAYARKLLRTAAGTGDAAATYHALQAWLLRLPKEERAALRSRGRSDALLDQLERHLFGTGGSWSRSDGAELAGLLGDRDDARHQKRGALPSTLPPLNPASPSPSAST